MAMSKIGFGKKVDREIYKDNVNAIPKNEGYRDKEGNRIYNPMFRARGRDSVQYDP